MFQFYAITFGSSFFNMILGYVKFANAIGFMQNAQTRVFVAYIGIVITSTMEWIYAFIIVMNNMFIYMLYRGLAFDSYWVDFNKFFLKHYKMNFTFATLVLSGLLVSIIHIARLSFILKTCFDRIGFWRTLCLLRNSPLAFVHSALTNLAIFDKFIEAEIEETEENVAMQAPASKVTVTTVQKEKKRCVSLPCLRFAPQKPLRYLSLPNIYSSSSDHFWKPIDVKRPKPSITNNQLHIAHSSEMEKGFRMSKTRIPNLTTYEYSTTKESENLFRTLVQTKLTITLYYQFLRHPLFSVL